jgi:teichuronic acid biosynthesis glycosyltransferase TuaG
MKNKVSVIIPTYNSSSTVTRSIESVLNQTHQNFEIIITDDNSNDNTVLIIKKYLKNHDNIKLFCLNVNQGAGYARNFSIKKASGDYIAFLDSDDYWYPNKLEIQIQFMKKRKIHFTYSSYDIIDEEGRMKNKINAKIKIDYNDILRNNYVGCFTAIYDVNYFGKLYMPQLRKRQDWCLWIDIIKKNGTIYGIKDSLGAYSIQKKSLSSNKIKLLKYNWLVYKQHLGFSYLSSIFLLFQYFVFYLYKKTFN